ncbi:MAG TPA: lipoyl synthase [Thermoanaerobaculia bacterium]|mgnify:FL=1|nr:lipoyl synthase [Thermoanaerobaculia bacterium]HPA52932.1 lipoyl synthase [Thermoanaerobaculia bacterium]HQP85828.1 lipoyl synthase [Thermoanaerobaculia bacterium]
MSGPPLPRFVPNPDRPVYGETPRPEWLKVRLVDNEDTRGILDLVRRKHLNTVCQEAQCPNIFECWGRERTATFMLMGDVCTRRCGFCAVTQGIGRPLDPEEPRHVAEAVKELGVRHAVVTSVNRDELPDGGAAHFAATIGAIRAANPGVTVEVLIPDFLGSEAALRTVLEAAPEVLNHNTETVARLYRRVRPDAIYARSLELLARAAAWRDGSAPAMRVKSGLMVGLGEELDEVLATMRDLRAAGTDTLTVGQYLQPHARRLPVERWWTPEEFARLRDEGRAMGFAVVEAGPLVRSSYHARAALGAAGGGDAAAPR